MDSKNYDEIRNLTILFFLDRLVDKGQPRTLHDLSCQFGTKGFTKEMRQIAGGSQSGLRKFLSQYPSLFTIDGEYVSITCYNNNSSSNTGSADGGGSGCGSGSSVPGRRDYAVEAVEYFREKLEQYGAAEVPIKSLLGHRSQATPEVRHISGQHIREFKDFLLKYPETFVVRDEYVVLRKHWDTVCEGGTNAGGVLERREPSPTPSVADLPSPVDAQLTGQILHFCRSFIEGRGPTLLDYLFAQLALRLSREVCSRIVKNAQDLSVLLKMHSDRFLVQGGTVSLVPPKQPSAVASRANSTLVEDGQTINGYDSTGATTASPIVSAPPSPSSRSNLPPASQSFKQRLMSHLIKAVADNNAMEQRVYQSPSAPAAGHPHSAHPAGFDVAQMNARLLKLTRVIVKVKECQSIVARLKSFPNAVVSFDAEGVNLGPAGPMTLMQMGTSDGQIFVFDLVACKELLMEGGLKEILESPSITKVVHDCRNDSAALFHQFGIMLTNVFDTQAAHAILQQQQTGKPIHKVKNISLNNLCRMYGGPINPKKEQMKKLYRRDQKFWSRRPLTEDMILYAAYDIWALVPTIYEALRSQLEGGSGNTLFQQLCHEQIDTYIRVDEVKQSKKQRKIETEVAELKRKLSSVSGKAVVLSNREIRLLRHVDLTDEEREKLEGSYKVARKLERLQTRSAAGGNRSNADSSETSPDFDDEEYDEEEEDEEEDELDGDDEEEEELEFGSSDSPDFSYGGMRRSRRSSSPSFEDSIRIVQEFLANEKFDHLAFGPDDVPNNGGNGVCFCSCHLSNRDSAPKESVAALSKPQIKTMADAACQTLSTGDIVITKVYFEDKDSPKGAAAAGMKVDKDTVKKC